MNFNRRAAVGTALSLLFVAFVVFALFYGGGSRSGIGIESATGYKPALVAVSDMLDGRPYPVQHTFLCSEKGVGIARDWHSTDRWVKNQLSYDRYVVDGRTFETLQIVTDDSTLPKQHVRFRKELVNVGSGPRLEGHDYMKTLINGRAATIQRELLFVEFNGVLEPQARPLPACGTPRS